MRRLLRGALLACLVAACAVEPPLLGDGQLKTVRIADSTSCVGEAIDGVLRGSPADGAVAWLEIGSNSARHEVVWPTGYTAQFVTVGGREVLEILDASGGIVLGEADVVSRACPWQTPATYLLMPPFR